MDGVEICEICGEYVSEEDLTECKICKKKGCIDCIEYDELLCDECITKER